MLERAKADAVLYPHQNSEDDIQADLAALAAEEDEMDAEMEAKLNAQIEEEKISELQGAMEVDVQEEVKLQDPVSQAESLPNMLSEAQETGGAEARDAEDDEDELPRLPTPPPSCGRLVQESEVES